MQKIKQLPLSEIKKIAAGQVVERPVNVVKELIENALDAGATAISLYSQAGGQKLIRVVDNGCGMSPEDAVACFERHATSKITNFDELQILTTFGFRGEALYTIGAVSSVTLITKQADSLYGSCIQYNEGLLIKTEQVSAQIGTDISVADLFSNVPVRKKFLKKEETEHRLIVQLFQAFCFAYPECHFQFFSENQLLYNCPAVINTLDRCVQLWQTGINHNDLLVMDGDSESNANATISGIISRPHCVRYNRNHIFLFVNKRWVRNYSLSQALLKGYLNALPAGRYPVAIIDLKIMPGEVDVNVHPRKEEVIFVHAKQIENALTALVKKRLEKNISEQLQPYFQQPVLSFPTQEFSTPFKQTFTQAHDDYLYKNNATQHNPLLQQPIVNNEIKAATPVKGSIAHELEQSHQHDVEQGVLFQQESVVENQERYEIVGVAKKTYIMLDHPEGILFVDQHAAHERVLYEQFAHRFQELPSVKLMFPEVVQLSAHDCALLMENTLLLHEHGIIFDQFSPHAITIQSIPVHLKTVSWPDFLREIIDILIECATLEKNDFFSMVHKKLQAQMACKAAVKAGDVLTEQQMKQLLCDLSGLENRFTCPHGRPTSWLLPLFDIEKKFKRKK